MNKDCIFCKLVYKELPAYIVYEDENVLAFLDIYPIQEGHTLIIPKRHSDGLRDLDEDYAMSLLPVAQKVARALYEEPFNVKGVNLLLSDGKAAGQEIFHTHLHVIPRYEHDKISFFAPRTQATKEQLEKVSKKLRELVNKMEFI